MRKLFLIVVVGCIAASLAFAGEPARGRRRRPSLDDRVKEYIDKYALDDEQALKVRKLLDESRAARRAAWQKVRQAGGGRQAIMAAMRKTQDVFRQKLVPLFEPEQLKVFFDEITKEINGGAEARYNAIRETLGLTAEDAAWKKLDELLKKVDDLKAELACKLQVAHSELRQLVDAAKKSDISKKLKEIDELKKEIGEKVEELMAKVRKSISDDKWAKLVLDQLVD